MKPIAILMIVVAGMIVAAGLQARLGRETG
jgi:hypothetical protein